MDPIETTDDSAVPVVVIAGHLIVHEDDHGRFVDAHTELTQRARAFDGCIHLAITADPLDPRRINNVEVWESVAALDVWRARSDPPDIDVEILEVSMHRYDASPGGTLF